MHMFTESQAKQVKKNGIVLSLPTEYNDRKALVVLIGWLGSTTRLLRHYAKVYTDMGYPVAAYIPNGMQFVAQYFSNQQVDSFVDALDQLKVAEKNCKIVIHAISNNGGTFYTSLMRSENPKFKPLKSLVVGVVAEAFPGVQTADIRICDVLSGRDLTATGGKKQPVTLFNLINPFWWFVTIMQWITWVYFYITIFHNGDQKGFRKYLGQLASLETNYPTLALYSEGDFAVPADQVENFWKGTGNSKVQLHLLEGKDVNHVQGLVKRPSEYKKAIETFVSQL